MQKDETERGAGGGGKREPARAGGPRSEVRAGRAGDGRAGGSRRPLGGGVKPSQSWSKLVKAALFYFFWGGRSGKQENGVVEYRSGGAS